MIFRKIKLIGSSNKPVIFFFIRLLVLVVFTISIYTYLLKPIHFPDRILTETIAKGTAFGLSQFTLTKVTAARNPYRPEVMDINSNGKTYIRIWDVCNGLDLIAIYLSLIILLPYKVSRKLFFCISGIIVLIVANIIRCMALYCILIYYNYLFDVNHHYVFTILIYLLIFYGWLLFTKSGRLHEVK